MNRPPANAPVRLASGAAWWGDRISPAAAVAEHGDLDYLCFETMAESTVSAAQVKKRKDPDFPGYDTWLDDRMHAVLLSMSSEVATDALGLRT